MLKHYALLFVLTLAAIYLPAQQRNKSNWIDFGGSHASKWLQIAPGKLRTKRFAGTTHGLRANWQSVEI